MINMFLKRQTVVTKTWINKNIEDIELNVL